MPNASVHRLGSGVAISCISASSEYKRSGELTAMPLIHGLLAALFGTLPDIVEPALHPNHRRFFHSLGFAGMLSYGLYRLSQWEAQDDLQSCLKTIGMITGGAYLVHLAMDATTPKSLPLI